MTSKCLRGMITTLTGLSEYDTATQAVTMLSDYNADLCRMALTVRTNKEDIFDINSKYKDLLDIT